MTRIKKKRRACRPSPAGLLAFRVKDIERATRTRARLFDQISLREPPAGGEDEDSAAEIAEPVGVIAAEADRVERLVNSLVDDIDRQIVRLALEGQTQGAIALALGVTQQAVGKRFQKNWRGVVVKRRSPFVQ